ncbi:hypothetical protein B0A49_00640 [Cryomyces minteri]|uniref:Uncharacterized protein n=1 Tax=Cryomyces minteri TaxID=331657 RepID=A0A4U0Y0B6_9PEZI|nr:hypothetical protein B0A49_00640 [Cryomyces minteri]
MSNTTSQGALDRARQEAKQRRLREQLSAPQPMLPFDLHHTAHTVSQELTKQAEEKGRAEELMSLAERHEQQMSEIRNLMQNERSSDAIRDHGESPGRMLGDR